jgi:hypothetical protein
MSTSTVVTKAGKLNLQIERYATFSVPLQFKQKAPPQDPIDFTGATFKMQIRENKQLPAVLMELTTGNGRIVSVDLTQGQIQILLTAAETATLEKKLGVYDLLATHGSGQVDRLLEGQVEVSDGVTHS